jgi:hypothetical protein
MNLTKVKGSPFNLRFFKVFTFREQCVVLVNNYLLLIIILNWVLLIMY